MSPEPRKRAFACPENALAKRRSLAVMPAGLAQADGEAWRWHGRGDTIPMAGVTRRPAAHGRGSAGSVSPACGFICSGQFWGDTARCACALIGSRLRSHGPETRFLPNHWRR